MALQKVINGRQPAGIVGEFSDNSPKSARAYIVKADAGKPTFGRFFSFADENVAGTSDKVTVAKQGISALTNTMGVLVNPKEHFSIGFTTSLTCENGVVGTVATQGHIWVLAKTDTVAGSPVYIDANGAIGTSNLASGTLVFGAKWLRTEGYPAFAATSAYKVGDKVTYNHGLYIAKEDIAAGAWNASKWNATEIVSEIAILNPLLKGEEGAGSL